MSKINYQKEIQSAKAEMEKWPEWKRISTRLEGTDKYFDQQQRQSAVTHELKAHLKQEKK